MTARKVSVTIDASVLEEVMRAVRARRTTLSEYVTEALAHEVRHARLADAIASFEKEHGPISEAERARARAKIERAKRKTRRRAA